MPFATTSTCLIAMLETIEIINTDYPWFFATLAFLLGACWGSFANVAIYRWPRKMSVLRPASHCFNCGAPIRWYDNLPVLGWVILRGKARCCGAPFSPRYAIVELLTGLLFLAAWLCQPPLVAMVGFVFIVLMVIGAFIDYDTQELPDISLEAGAAIGLILAPIFPAMHGYADEAAPLSVLLSIGSGLLGLVVGSGVILWIALFAEKLFRKEVMGFGDVVLMGCIGAFCGWQGALFAIFGGAALGSLIVMLLMVINRLTGWQLTPGKVERPENPTPAETETTNEVTAQAEAPAADSETPTEPHKGGEAEESPDLGIGVAVPFGPWLALGGLIYFIWLREPINAYFADIASVLSGM